MKDFFTKDDAPFCLIIRGNKIMFSESDREFLAFHFNQKLNSEIEKWPKVYGNWDGNIQTELYPWTGIGFKSDNHVARLAFIEPMINKP